MKRTSFLATLVLGGVSYVLIRAIPHGTRIPFAESFGTAMAVVPALTAGIALLFIVTSYEVTHTDLRIQRLLWATTLPLSGLTRVWHDPQAMRRSLRVFGNGGLDSVTGLFQNRGLGRYRAFVTDPRKSVVLSLPTRTIVVSPHDPEAFVRAVTSLFPGAHANARAGAAQPGVAAGSHVPAAEPGR